MLIGLFAGRLLDTGHVRLVFIVGAFLEVSGTLMASICTQHWQLLLSQGICVGIGSGLLGQTSLVVIPLYFRSRRMIAIGIAATGASLGMHVRGYLVLNSSWLTRAPAGIIYSIMMRKLFLEVGFGWAVRILAFVMLFSLAVCYAVMELDLPQRKPGPLFKIVFLKDPSYFVFTMGEQLSILHPTIPDHRLCAIFY